MANMHSFVKGPFKDEAAFKAAVLRVWRERSSVSTYTRFEIENEEKEPGMPDCLSISPTRPAFFTEFKISDKNGVVEFQKTQPRFYNAHKEVLIDVLVWDARYDRVVAMTAAEVVAAKSLKIRIPEELG